MLQGRVSNCSKDILDGSCYEDVLDGGCYREVMNSNCYRNVLDSSCYRGVLDGSCYRGVLGVGPTRTYCTAIGTGMCWLAIVSYGVALDGSCLGDDSLKKSLPPKCPDTT